MMGSKTNFRSGGGVFSPCKQRNRIKTPSPDLTHATGCKKHPRLSIEILELAVILWRLVTIFGNEKAEIYKHLFA
jgi:hypothetical protein